MSNVLRSAADRKPKHPQTHHPINIVEESEFEHIQGGVIDAFNRDGHKEVERRIALLHREYPNTKERVMLVGDEHGQEQFLINMYGNDHRTVALKGMAHFPLLTVREVLDLRKSNRITPRQESEMFSGHFFTSEKLTKQIIDEVEYSQMTGSPITTVVTLWQDGHDRYLKKFVDALPGIDVYNICYFDPTGRGRSFARRWRTGAGLFETQSELADDSELRWVIEGIAHEGESTWFGAPPKQGKTWVQLCVAKALLTGESLFGDVRLKVPRKAERVIYLCPETGRKPFFKRLKMLGLVEHLHDPITNPEGRLFIRTLSAGEKIKLDDPALLQAVVGADVFLDTAIRWLEGDENKSGDVKILSENIFNLISVGVRSVWCAHHAIKFDDASSMTLNNMFRGSGEYGAALSNAIGLLQEDKELNKVRFHPIVSRDLDELIPDMILQGRPYLGEIGNFKVVEANAEPRKAGAPGDALKQQKIDFARGIAGSYQDRADAVNEKFGTRHTKGTIHEWLKEFDAEVSHE
jgi:AAA domain